MHLEVAPLKGLGRLQGYFFLHLLLSLFPPLIPLPFLYLPLPPPVMTLPQARSHAISIAFRHKKLSPRH